VPFDEIALIVDRSPEATRQLVSRARRRVQGEKTVPDADIDTQRDSSTPLHAAARVGHFEALVAVLGPDVMLRAASTEVLDLAAPMIASVFLQSPHDLEKASSQPEQQPVCLCDEGWRSAVPRRRRAWTLFWIIEIPRR
jgi:hypothetical protein